MADTQETLAIVDAENAYKGILGLVLNFPNFPTGFKANNNTVRWNAVGDNNTIGLYPLQGAVYLKKYISGSYVGLLPFEIIYKVATTTNKATITAQECVEELAKWLESGAITFEDNRLSLENIERTTPVFVASQDATSTEYAINLTLRYSYKK